MFVRLQHRLWESYAGYFPRPRLFDGAHSPVLEQFPAYLDLATAPDDMVPWLAQWVGMSVDLGEDLAHQRELLGSAGELHAIRGTRRAGPAFPSPRTLSAPGRRRPPRRTGSPGRPG